MDNSTLVVVITSLPTRATLYSVSEGIITAVGTEFKPSEFYLIGNDLTFGDDQFEFKVRDLVGLESEPSLVSIIISHVNHPPTAVFESSVEAIRTVPLDIELGVEDVDADEEFVFNITSFQAGDGVFLEFGTK